MANQVAARLSGDDYQHLVGWFEALQLLLPQKSVRLVRVEDAQAASMDDVTVFHEHGTSHSNRFYQVKYHVDLRGQYSTEELLKHDPGSRSLLQKFWDSWRVLRDQDAGRAIELHLISNWAWSTTDKIGLCIDGISGALTEAFFTQGAKSDVGKLREQWREHLEADSTDFTDFTHCLRFRLGSSCASDLEIRVSERMELLHLRSDASALLLAAGIVRNWVKKGRQDITTETMQQEIEKHSLALPDDCERCVTVYMTTIKEQRFDVPPDYALDWRDLFEGREAKKGHAVIDPSSWNARMLPDLEKLEGRINADTDCRLVHARGLSRLSAWFAFGHTFSGVNRYTIEVDQQGLRWRTDATPNPDFDIIATNDDGTFQGDTIHGTGTTVAVGISLTGSLEQDVRADLSSRQKEGEPVNALLLIEPARGTGPTCLTTAGDVTAFALKAKEIMRGFVTARQATRMLLYYFGPLSGACFLGHQLNAVCREIQIMEDQRPGYAPAFLLTD